MVVAGVCHHKYGLNHGKMDPPDEDATGKIMSPKTILIVFRLCRGQAKSSLCQLDPTSCDLTDLGHVQSCTHPLGFKEKSAM